MAVMRVVLIVAVSAIAVYYGLNLLYPRAAAPIEPAAVQQAAPAIDNAAAKAPPAAPADRTPAAVGQPGPPLTKVQIAAALPPATAPAPAPAPKPTPADDAVDEQPAAPAAGTGPWWAAAGTGATHLALLQADEAGFEPGIALLFSSPVSAQSASRHIRVLDRRGRSVGGQWQVSADNPRMMLFPTPSGTYTLALAPELTDTRGTTLGSALRGAVTVH